MAIQGMYQEGTVEQKIELLSMVQMSILDYLMDGDRKQGNNPADLLRSLIAGTMANDRLRTDFTEFAFDNAPDDIKTFVMEMNEIVNDIIKEEE